MWKYLERNCFNQPVKEYTDRVTATQPLLHIVSLKLVIESTNLVHLYHTTQSGLLGPVIESTNLVHLYHTTQSGLLGPERVSRPQLKQDSSCSNRQHHSGVAHKQGRRHDIGHTVCRSVENPDLVFQETGESKPDTFRAG